MIFQSINFPDISRLVNIQETAFCQNSDFEGWRLMSMPVSVLIPSLFFSPNIVFFHNNVTSEKEMRQMLEVRVLSWFHCAFGHWHVPACWWQPEYYSPPGCSVPGKGPNSFSCYYTCEDFSMTSIKFLRDPANRPSDRCFWCRVYHCQLICRRKGWDCCECVFNCLHSHWTVISKDGNRRKALCL